MGVGCVGTSGTPVLDVSQGRGAFVGEVFQLAMEPLPMGAGNKPFGLIGFSKDMWGASSLPLDLGPIFGMSGCNAYINPEFSFGLVNLGGSTCWELDVPMDSSLVGLTFYVQGLVFDQGANAGGGVVSNAIEATIGIR